MNQKLLYIAPFINIAKSTQLGKVQLAPEEEIETAQMIRSPQKFCRNNRELCVSDLREYF